MSDDTMLRSVKDKLNSYGKSNRPSFDPHVELVPINEGCIDPPPFSIHEEVLMKEWIEKHKK